MQVGSHAHVVHVPVMMLGTVHAGPPCGLGEHAHPDGCLADPRAVMDKVTAAIQDLGIEIEQIHNEGAPGQFEVVTAHQPAMQARACPSALWRTI